MGSDIGGHHLENTGGTGEAAAKPLEETNVARLGISDSATAQPEGPAEGLKRSEISGVLGHRDNQWEGHWHQRETGTRQILNTHLEGYHSITETFSNIQQNVTHYDTEMRTLNEQTAGHLGVDINEVSKKTVTEAAHYQTVQARYLETMDGLLRGKVEVEQVQGVMQEYKQADYYLRRGEKNRLRAVGRP